MRRRLFDHLHAELSVVASRVLPRYALWLRLHDLGFDPERLTPSQALAFCDRGAAGFLAERGKALPPRLARLLRRRVAGFDPSGPTPSERIAHLVGDGRG